VQRGNRASTRQRIAAEILPFFRHRNYANGELAFFCPKGSDYKPKEFRMIRKFVLAAAVAIVGLTSLFSIGSAQAQPYYYHPYGYGYYHGWGYPGWSRGYGYGYRYPHCWYNYYGALVCN
jgi:hypothetical protein